MKKLPASSQNALLLEALRRAAHRRRERVAAPAAGVGSGTVAPNGIRPMSAGRSRRKSATSGSTTAIATVLTVSDGVAPAPVRHDRSEDGQEDQVPGGARSGQDAGDEAAPLARTSGSR